MSKLLDLIARTGQSPQVGLVINPLSKTRPQIILDKFLRYNFQSSVLIPVDAFNFSFSMPNVDGPIDSFIQEGDLVQLTAAGQTIATGIIDVTDIETTTDGGDVVTIMGRNLIGQLEDQSTVNTIDKPMWGNSVPLESAVGAVVQNTRIRGLKRQQAPEGNFLFATAPGESKLSALQRFVEPLNCLIWGDPNGYLLVGRPNMGQDPLGDLVMDRKGKFSNVLNMKAVRSSTQIPNIIIPVWSGQETVQNRVAAQQRVLNPSDGPSRLRLGGHNVQKCVVVSTPSGSDPQSLSDINAIKVGGSNLLQAYALREIARANINELTVQCNVKSHFNDDLTPFMVDQVYNVNYSRAGVQEKMYLYQVEYSMDAVQGSRTSLYLCKLGRIVAGVSIASVERKILNSGELPKA